MFRKHDKKDYLSPYGQQNKCSNLKDMFVAQMSYRYDDRMQAYDCSSYFYAEDLTEIDKERLGYVCALNVIPISIFELIVLCVFIGLLLVVIGLCAVITKLKAQTSEFAEQMR